MTIDDCIVWRGCIDSHGYATLSYKNRIVAVHRYVYAWINGPIPPGLYVLHSCDVRSCVNPSHLRLGTHADNMRDMAIRKRQPGLHATHCKHGHEYTPANTYRHAKKGTRGCRRCRALAAYRYRDSLLSVTAVHLGD